MIFASGVFLFLFLPLFLAAYYVVPARWRTGVILAGSLAFYAWWRLDFLVLIVAVTIAGYLVSLRIVAATEERVRRRWLAVGIVLALATLGYFKYFNFGIASLNALLGSVGAAPLDMWSVILPIGISFHVFQTISYLIDVTRGDARPAPDIWRFSAFNLLFPQLVAGPVVRYKDVERQFEARAHSLDTFGEGAWRFMVGFCKKVLIADPVARIVDLCFAQGDPSFGDAWLGAVSYTIQLYFDFSGYSDMAIGLGLMMGFRFPENFDRPYASASITEFWRRWHMSLSAWLRDYLYIPLGGNRRGVSRTYLNLAATMALGGLWHGANWTFVLWGAWHGGLLAAERLGRANTGFRVPRPLAVALTLLFIVLGWVMFRAPDVGTALGFYGAMAGTSGFGLGEAVVRQVPVSSLAILLVGIAFAVFEVRRGFFAMTRSPTAIGAAPQIAAVALFAAAVLQLSSTSYSPFLYFQF